MLGRPRPKSPASAFTARTLPEPSLQKQSGTRLRRGCGIRRCRKQNMHYHRLAGGRIQPLKRIVITVDQPLRDGGLRNPEDTLMRAIVIQQYGGPEQLTIQPIPDPEPKPGRGAIEVKASGINHAETHMRKGEWAEAAKVSGAVRAGALRDDSQVDPPWHVGYAKPRPAIRCNTRCLASRTAERQFGNITSGVFTHELAKPSETFSLAGAVPLGVDRIAMRRSFRGAHPTQFAWCRRTLRCAAVIAGDMSHLSNNQICPWPHRLRGTRQAS